MTTTLFTTVEVAERLGLSAAAVAQAVRSGQLEPAARTADDFLFNERAIAAFERARSLAAAEPPPAAPESSRAEWANELGRLNSWLGELNSSLAAPADAAPLQVGPAQPIEAREQPAVEPSEIPPPQAEPPAVAETHLQVHGELISPGGSAAQPALPADAPHQVHEVARPPSRPVSRQAVLVVRPITRFRIVGEVVKALSQLPGLAAVRLEGIDQGVANYRLTMGDKPASADEIAAALASFNLELMLVEAGDE